MADRRRHHPVETRVARTVVLAALAQPQVFHVAPRGQYVRPHALQEFQVAGVAPIAGDGMDQLAVAVVFRHRVAAARVHAARHHAAVELVGRIPFQVLPHRVLAAQPQQPFGDHRAVADPAARIRARARLQARPHPRDQHVRQRGAQRIGQRLAGLGQLQPHLVQLLPPHRRDLLLRLVRVETAGHRPVAGLRQHQRDLAALPRLQFPSVEHRAGRQPARVADLARARQGLVGQVGDVELAVERTGETGIGRRRGEHPRLAVDRHPGTLDRQPLDPAHAADGIEELAGRVDLERPHRQRQPVFVRHLVRVVQAVTGHQLRLLGAALHETGDLQAESVVLPFDRGNRQVTVLQALAGAHVGPAQHLAVEHHERLDAEAGARRLQGAVLAHQRLLAAPVQAQQGPVRLLAGEAPRQRPARQVARDRAHEIIGRGGRHHRRSPRAAGASRGRRPRPARRSARLPAPAPTGSPRRRTRAPCPGPG